MLATNTHHLFERMTTCVAPRIKSKVRVGPNLAHVLGLANAKIVIISHIAIFFLYFYMCAWHFFNKTVKIVCQWTNEIAPFSPLRWINNVSSTTCFSLMSYANNKAKARHPTEHIQMGGAMSEMRYAYTNFLIVTCYLLPQGRNDVVPSLCLRSAFAMPSL